MSSLVYYIVIYIVKHDLDEYVQSEGLQFSILGIMCDWIFSLRQHLISKYGLKLFEEVTTFQRERERERERAAGEIDSSGLHPTQYNTTICSQAQSHGNTPQKQQIQICQSLAFIFKIHITSNVLECYPLCSYLFLMFSQLNLRYFCLF